MAFDVIGVGDLCLDFTAATPRIPATDMAAPLLYTTSQGGGKVPTALVALRRLGGEYRETRAFTLPDGSERRLVVCKKISQTPTAYPRNGGKIAKKPL